MRKYVVILSSKFEYRRNIQYTSFIILRLCILRSVNPNVHHLLFFGWLSYKTLSLDKYFNKPHQTIKAH